MKPVFSKKGINPQACNVSTAERPDGLRTAKSVFFSVMSPKRFHVDRSPSVLAQKLDGRSSPLPESRDSQGNRLCHQTSAGTADVAACFPSRPVRAMGNRGHGVWQ